MEVVVASVQAVDARGRGVGDGVPRVSLVVIVYSSNNNADVYRVKALLLRRNRQARLFIGHSTRRRAMAAGRPASCILYVCQSEQSSPFEVYD